MKDLKENEFNVNEGDKCPECGGVMLVSYTGEETNYSKTYTCVKCGLTESE
jgi:predicted RNA-binding Zn-ribbon protein involved in translation (DUF1610 family)